MQDFLHQNFTPGRHRRAESESKVENFEILHPELEIKEKHLECIIFYGGYLCNGICSLGLTWFLQVVSFEFSKLFLGFCYVLLCFAMFCYVSAMFLLCFAMFCYVFAMICYVFPCNLGSPRT